MSSGGTQRGGGGVALPTLCAWWRSRVRSRGKGGEGDGGVAPHICADVSWDSLVLPIFTGMLTALSLPLWFCLSLSTLSLSHTSSSSPL